MKNQSPPDQKDLFGDSSEPDDSRTESIRTFFRLKTNPLFSFSLEQIFVTLIVILILFVLVFMMGVLRGRALKAINGNPIAVAQSRRGMPVQPVSSYTAPQAAQLNAQNSAQSPNTTPSAAPSTSVEAPLANIVKKPYTIQLVTYRNEERALKEIADLKARGLAPRLVRRSGYFEVCVGQYADRKEAQKDLRTLSNRYKGCYLRKI